MAKLLQNDEFLNQLRDNPEFNQALQEGKRKGLHLLSKHGLHMLWSVFCVAWGSFRVLIPTLPLAIRCNEQQ